MCQDGSLQLAENRTLSIISPGFPELYPINVDCAWIISTSDNSNVALRFLEFGISSWLWDYGFEYLDIGIGDIANSTERHIRLQGTLFPQSLIVRDSTVWMIFHSSKTINDQNIGFEIEVSRTIINGKNCF